MLEAEPKELRRSAALCLMYHRTIQKLSFYIDLQL